MERRLGARRVPLGIPRRSRGRPRVRRNSSAATTARLVALVTGAVWAVGRGDLRRLVRGRRLRSSFPRSERLELGGPFDEGGSDAARTSRVLRWRQRERMAEMQSADAGGRPAGQRTGQGILVLHDAEAEKSVVILFFDNEDDYAQGDAALSAMPADETPAGARRREVRRRLSMTNKATTALARGRGSGDILEREPFAVERRQPSTSLPIVSRHPDVNVRPTFARAAQRGAAPQEHVSIATCRPARYEPGNVAQRGRGLLVGARSRLRESVGAADRRRVRGLAAGARATHVGAYVNAGPSRGRRGRSRPRRRG